MKKIKDFLKKFKYQLIAIGTILLGILGVTTKHKANKQIKKNVEQIDVSKEVMKEIDKVQKTTKEVIDENEKILNKYSDLRNNK